MTSYGYRVDYTLALGISGVTEYGNFYVVADAFLEAEDKAIKHINNMHCHSEITDFKMIYCELPEVVE